MVGEGEEDEEMEQVVYKYVPPVPKDWITQGRQPHNMCDYLVRGIRLRHALQAQLVFSR